MQKPRIAMSPDALPQQRLHPVQQLPEKPETFDAVVVDTGETPAGIAPKRRPSRMIYLGSVEWAWSPMHGRIEGYYLHRGRQHWILYVRNLDPDEAPVTWAVSAYARRGSANEQQAACHLMIAKWRFEEANCYLDHFHWINQTGFLDVARWMAIAREVWP